MSNKRLEDAPRVVAKIAHPLNKKLNKILRFLGAFGFFMLMGIGLMAYGLLLI